MIQLVRESVELFVEKKLMITAASDVKFLQVIVPAASENYNLKLKIAVEDDLYSVSGSIEREQQVFFKINCTLSERK